MDLEERGVEWVKKIRVNGVLDPIASPSKISKNQRIQDNANHPQLRMVAGNNKVLAIF